MVIDVVLSAQQASRYRRRDGRLRPLFVSHPPQPDLIASQTTVASHAIENLEPNTIQRMLEMQLTLERSLSLGANHISIGVNQIAQAPQDLVNCYSQSCQTDIVMVHDVATDTKKITLDFSVQCISDNSEMYTQTEAPFMKNKNVQTDFIRINGVSQTDKPKTRNASLQTPAKSNNDKGSLVSKNSFDHVDASTETQSMIMCDKAVETDVASKRLSKDSDGRLNSRTNEKSNSPPLSSEKETPESQPYYSFPLVSMYNPLAVMLPNIGTYEDNVHFVLISFINVYITDSHLVKI